MVKIIDENKINKEDEICPCCGFPIDGKLYSLTCKNTDLTDIGIGFSFYFIFVKFLAFQFFIAFFLLELYYSLSVFRQIIIFSENQAIF